MGHIFCDLRICLRPSTHRSARQARRNHVDADAARSVVRCRGRLFRVGLLVGQCGADFGKSPLHATIHPHRPADERTGAGRDLGVERAQLATTFDSAARAQLELQIADARLAEAQRLFAAGRVNDGVRGMAQYDTAVTQFHQSIASTALDVRAVDDLSRSMDDRAARADASLKALAGTLAAGGDPEAAAAVTRTRSHVDQAWSGSKQDLQSRGSASHPGDQRTKPGGGVP